MVPDYSSGPLTINSATKLECHAPMAQDMTHHQSQNTDTEPALSISIHVEHQTYYPFESLGINPAEK